MCKIIFQILLSISISSQLIAQTHPIKSLTIGNEWFYKQGSSAHGSGHSACSFAYKITKDTLIDNEIFYQFKKTLGQVYGGSGMCAWSSYYERADSVRAEAIIGQGYPREITYDFSMNIGDTLFNPMLYSDPGYTRYVTTIAKGDTILWGENLPYLKIRSLSDFYGHWGSSTILAVEKFGVVSIYYRGVDEGYYRRLTGAVINGIAYGDTTNTYSGIKSVTPGNNSLNSELSPVISMSFYESRDAALLNDTNILVYAAHSGAQFINTMNYNPDTQILDFTLKSPLTPGEDVTVTLNGLYYAFRFKAQTIGGTGIFSKSDEFVLPYISSVLKAGDFDLDGDLDLISGSRSHAITLIKNESESGFIVTPSPVLYTPYPVIDILPLDFDLNGDLGLIISTDMSDFSVNQKETGSGVFGDLNAITGTPRSGVLADLKTTDWAVSFYSGDINGDGSPDLITKWGILRNFGGHFLRSPLFGWNLDRETKSLAFGDFNEDSYLDLAATQENSSILLLYLNNGLGQFSLKDSLNNVASSESIISGDIDGDADLDLVLSNGTVLINSGKGKFVHGVPFNINCQKIEFGDVDGDFDLDLVGITGNSLLVFKNNGTGIFSISSILDLENHPNSLVIGDWDNDGDLDIAVAYDESNIVAIFKNDYTSPELPTFALEQNFPNPCSKSTYFCYKLPEDMNVTLSIYNIRGELVTRLFSGYKEAGTHLISWLPGSVSSGIYFFQVRTPKGTKNIKFSVVK